MTVGVVVKASLRVIIIARGLIKLIGGCVGSCIQNRNKTHSSLMTVAALMLSMTSWESYAIVPEVVGGACPEVAAVLAAGTLAAATGATGTDTVSIPARGPVWGFASNCWASGKA